jgi:hypothetical protein
MDPVQEAYSGPVIPRDGCHPLFSAYTSHHQLMSLNDSRIQPLSGLTMLSSMPQQSAHHSHHDEPGGDAFATDESNLSTQSMPTLPNEPNTHPLQPIHSYT